MKHKRIAYPVGYTAVDKHEPKLFPEIKIWKFGHVFFPGVGFLFYFFNLLKIFIRFLNPLLFYLHQIPSDLFHDPHVKSLHKQVHQRTNYADYGSKCEG